VTAHVTGAAGEKIAITRISRVPWHPDDERALLVDAIIIGRARIDVAGGGLLHGLIVARVERETMDVTRHAVWWDRYTNRFVSTELGTVRGSLHIPKMDGDE
jgi:hypothetical protein